VTDLRNSEKQVAKRRKANGRQEGYSQPFDPSWIDSLRYQLPIVELLGAMRFQHGEQNVVSVPPYDEGLPLVIPDNFAVAHYWLQEPIKGSSAGHPLQLVGYGAQGPVPAGGKLGVDRS
jgi:hypothetical protein